MCMNAGCDVPELVQVLMGLIEVLYLVLHPSLDADAEAGHETLNLVGKVWHCLLHKSLVHRLDLEIERYSVLQLVIVMLV